MKGFAQRTPELVAALRSLIRAARAERGFLNGHIWVDFDDSNAIRYEERWESQRDLENQLQSSRFTQLLTLMESAMERPSLEFHFLYETRGLEYVASVREHDRNEFSSAE
jgi:quinol monooxygenase YgiN